ncbi:MAG: radical SAM protein [Methanosphaera stadtmanae]|nr:radical SAM protein [Methanosphaera stadtmanae]
MHFASQILRPPYEARSKFLQVTTGCSHNKCRFCNYFKDVSFSISPTDEIIEDLEELKENNNTFKRIWLQGADPFSLSFNRLYEIALMIHEYLPFVQTIGSYARVDSLKNKSIEELRILKDVGYNSIVFGIESGDSCLLKYMNKGFNASDIVEELSKMDESDFDYTVIFLNGLGGHGYGLNHAIKTAEIINQLHPKRVMVTGLTVFEDTPLMNDINCDDFIEADEKERIEELIVFLDKLEIETFIDATNASNSVPIFGKFPENDEAMIRHLKEIYEKYGEKTLRNKRENLNKV